MLKMGETKERIREVRRGGKGRKSLRRETRV
jgi:hypothetical protein